MIIVNKYALQEIRSAITNALLGCCDHHGHQVVMGTLDPELLDRVALGALTMAAGDVCWPDGKTIEKGPEEQLRFIRTVYPKG